MIHDGFISFCFIQSLYFSNRAWAPCQLKIEHEDRPFSFTIYIYNHIPLPIKSFIRVIIKFANSIVRAKCDDEQIESLLRFISYFIFAFSLDAIIKTAWWNWNKKKKFDYFRNSTNRDRTVLGFSLNRIKANWKPRITIE